ncbi:MAG: ComEC family competence protein [Candidatus Melainabacteria bacterium]|nr:ComEC family competence protein [Candidatus Melainabacteria bacterium]
MNKEALIDKLQEYKNPVCLITLGILTGSTFYFKNITIYLLLAVLVIFSLLFLVRTIDKKKTLIFLTFIVFGFTYSKFFIRLSTTNLDYLLNKQKIYIGEILSTPEVHNLYNKTYIIKLNSILDKNKILNLSKNKVKVIGSHYEEYNIGDVIQITGKLVKPNHALLPGLFDERNYLYTKGIFYKLITRPGTLVYLDTPPSTFITRSIYKIRSNLISTNKKYLKKENESLVNAILLGSKASKIDFNLKEKIQSLGLSHITSASGFNIAVLVGGIFYFLKLFHMRSIYLVLFSILAVILYSIIADFSASIIRASILIILILIGNLFNKKIKLLPAISLIIMLFFISSPLNLLDIGLQLSLLAFLGLALFAISLIKKDSSQLKIIALQSLFAQIMTVPLIIFYFHNLQIMALISNLIAVPLASIILILGLINILINIIPLLGFLNIITSALLNISSDLFLNWINLLSKITFKEIFMPSINFYLLLLIYVLIFYVLIIIFIKEARKNLVLYAILFIVLFLTINILNNQSNYVKIFCIPKYNNEAILIARPKEKPIYLSNYINEKDKKQIKDFLRLNNIQSNCLFFNTKNFKDEILIQYKNFSFKIITNLNKEFKGDVEFLKLPLLMKEAPPLKSVLMSYPKVLIVNDYKKLSKKSKKDIDWLKSLPIKILYLSKTGTITIFSNGKKSFYEEGTSN